MQEVSLPRVGIARVLSSRRCVCRRQAAEKKNHHFTH